MVAIKHFIQLMSYENTGKTTTMVWCLLKFLQEEQSASKLKFLKYLGYGDFIAVVEHDSKTIGFISASETIRKSYETLCKEFQGNIEICIFATRTGGHSTESFQEILRENGKEKPDKVIEKLRINIEREKRQQTIEINDKFYCRSEERSNDIIDSIHKILTDSARMIKRDS